MAKRKRSVLLEDKIIFTFMIILLYIIGRCIPLYGIDASTFVVTSFDAQSILTQTVSGDLNQSSILALGIAPYMLASLPIMVINACRSSEAKASTSQVRMNQITVNLMLILALVQALYRLDRLQFTGQGKELILQQVIAVVQMIAGAFYIMWLSRRNRLYGIGGQTTLIYINLLDSARMSLTRCDGKDLIKIIIIALFGIVVMLLMENGEKRIPVQRISIHNVYSDKNYYAIKLNPIGIMPIMFASTVFMLPQWIAGLLLHLFPGSQKIMWFIDNCVLTEPLGVGIFIAILFILSTGFSLIFLNPSETAEQFLKSGDSIVNVHAGEDTKRYLLKQVLGISLFSAVVMSLCMGIPIALQVTGKFNNYVMMIPTTLMMLTGIWCKLYQEMEGVKNLDSYEKFLQAK